jgi:hypothetical protein
MNENVGTIKLAVLSKLYKFYAVKSCHNYTFCDISAMRKPILLKNRHNVALLFSYNFYNWHFGARLSTRQLLVSVFSALQDFNAVYAFLKNYNFLEHMTTK